MNFLKKLSALLLFAAMLFTCGCNTDMPDVTTEQPGAATKQPDVNTSETDGETTPVTTEPADGGSIYVNPVFSIAGGFYPSGATLELSLPENAPEGTYITYTDDGNEPTNKSEKYTKSISVAKNGASVIRAACFDSNGEYLGRIKTNTYIKRTAVSGGLDVVSLVSDENNLYGDDGIISNPRGSGSEWERPCHVEIFNGSGAELISQDAGIRIFGGSSRALPQKSFRLVARKDGYYDEVKYNGNGSFDYALFDGRTVKAGENAGNILERYDRLILRNGGNDSFQATAADKTRMTLTRDAVANAFMAEYAEGVATQASRFAAVFLNGEYYGILDMKEDVNDDYMQNVYGLDKNNVTVIKSELDTSRHCNEHSNGGECRFCNVWFYYEVDDGADTELDEYTKLCKDSIKALSGSDADMAAAYKKLSEKLDTDSFMRYAAVSLYCCNTDWPHNNVRLWRYTGDEISGNAYSNGKWYFSTRDMDFSFGRYVSRDILPELYTTADTDNLRFTLGNYINGTYEFDGNYPDSLYLQGVLALCLHDDAFRSAFVDFCNKLCSSEAQTKLISFMNMYSGQISGEMKSHLDRWEDTIASKFNTNKWKINTDDMIKWASERPEYFKAHLSSLIKYFE